MKEEIGTIDTPSPLAHGIHSNAPLQCPALRVSFHLHHGTYRPLVTNQSGTVLADTVQKEQNTELVLI